MITTIAFLMVFAAVGFVGWLALAAYAFLKEGAWCEESHDTGTGESSHS